MTISNSPASLTKAKRYFLFACLVGMTIVVYLSIDSWVNPPYSSLKFIHTFLPSKATTGPSNSNFSTASSDVTTSKREFPEMPWLTNLTTYAKPCSPLKDVAYIFNRKTGSTTLVTILDRFGKQNHLPFRMMTIFHKGKSYIGNLETYLIHGENSPGASLPVMGTRREDRTLVARTGQTLNFAAVSPMQVKVIERAPQTILLSIVREPAANFESAFNFFNLYKYVNKHPSSNPGEKIKEFLQKPEYYRNKVSKGRNWCVARNGQAWHLGLDHKYHDREDIVEEYFSRLANELDLVFVTEYYDHSLILLKRIMCWKMENILYIARRVRSKRTPLTQDMKDKIRNWNYVDVKLYQIFNRTLWSKIDQYGPEFDNDLQDFRQLRDAVSKDCNLHKTLIKETIQLLAKHGSHVTDSRKFCMKLLAWFTMDDGLELAGGSHGIGAYTSLVKGTKDPLGSFKSENAGNGEQCIKVYYHKAISSKDRKSLDIYISKMGSNISNIEVQNTTNGSYVASYTTGEWEYFQVTTHVKYATDGYLIDALSMTNGRCDD